MVNYTSYTGTKINAIILKDDGTTRGFNSPVTIYDPIHGNYTDKIGEPIDKNGCSIIGYNWDEATCRCLWKDISNNTDVKLELSLNNNDGEIIYSGVNDTISLEISFDYLLEFNTDDFYGNIQNYSDILTGLNVSMTIDYLDLKDVEENLIYESPYRLKTVYSEDLINITGLTQFLSGNTNTGILINGLHKNNVINNIINSLGNSSFVVSATSFNSCWVKFSTIITDQNIIKEIANKKIKLGVLIKNVDVEFSVLFNQFKINKHVETIKRTDKQILRCPGFDLERVIDNRKSWRVTNNPENRNYSLISRETDYVVNDSRLIINSKELDLEVDPSLAIEENIMRYMDNNYPCVLSGGSIDLTGLIITPFTALTSTDEFTSLINNEFIDVKNRQIIQSYPTLRYLYETYMNPGNNCSISGKFNYSDLIRYSKSLGNYWVDIIEQLIPATTIWGSSYIYRNSIFDSQKYKYKQYSLVTTYPENGYISSRKNDVEVIISDIELAGDSTYEDYHNAVYLTDFNSSPIFRGSITILNNNNNHNILQSN